MGSLSPESAEQAAAAQNGGGRVSNVTFPPPSRQSDWGLTGSDRSAGTRDTSLKPDPITPMCSDPMLGSGPAGIGPHP